MSHMGRRAGAVLPDPAKPLTDPRRKRFAHLRLIGLTPPIAARQAGIVKQSGEPLADGNTWKIGHEPRVAARIAYLAGIATARACRLQES